MITFNKTDTPIIELYNKDKLNKDFKFNKDATPDKILYLDNNDNKNMIINQLEPFIPFPVINNKERFSAFIHGNSHSGKSCMASNLIFLLNKNIKNIKFLYFTGVSLDKPLLKYFKYLFSDEDKNKLMLFTPKSFIDIKLFNDKNPKNKLKIPLTVDEINDIQLNNNNCDIACVFDDIDSIGNKTIKFALENLEADIALTGRSHGKTGNIHFISISHVITAQTPRIRRLLLETKWNIFNIKSQNDTHIKNLTKKLGYSDELTNEIIKQKHNSGTYIMTFLSSSYPYIVFNKNNIIIE